jgi:hypothetical protein
LIGAPDERASELRLDFALPAFTGLTRRGFAGAALFRRVIEAAEVPQVSRSLSAKRS